MTSNSRSVGSILGISFESASVSDPIVVAFTTAMAFGLAVFVYRRFSSDRGNPHLKIVEAPHKISHVKEDPQADEDPGKTKVTIFYGIQTGTAEGFAKGNERSVLLQQLTYGVFGLGNHQYKHFNKLLRRELLRLVIHDPTISAWEDKYANLVNGHAEFDIHHPWPSWDDLHQPKSAAGTNREDGARFQYSCGAHHQEASADHVQLQKVGVRWQSRIGCLWSRPRRVHAGVCSPAWCLSWQ